MFNQIAVLGALLAANLLGQGHGHAISSRSVIRHDEPAHYTAHHEAPVSHYSSADAHYAAPIANYAAPGGHYAAPAAHYAPSVGRYAPAPLTYAAPITHHDGYDAYSHPKYAYAYSEVGSHTGDHNSQHESHDVNGYYPLAQPIRRVEYTANAHNGFNAVVHNSAPSLQPHAYGHHY